MAYQPFPDLTFHSARPLMPSIEPLRVIIIGADLAGLAAGIAFARKGHKVIIYEARTISAREEAGTVVLFQPNVTKILQRWDMLEDVKKIAHANLAQDVRDYADLQERIASIDVSMSGEDKHMHWVALRGDVLELFRLKALQCGVKIWEGVRVTHLGLGDNVGGRPSVSVSDAKTVEADIVIGADGARSKVREQLFPEFDSKILEKAVWSICVPLSVLDKPELAAMKESYQIGHAVIVPSPGKAVLAFPVPNKRLLAVEVIDDEASLQQDATAPPGEWLEDLSQLKARVRDADPAITSIISTVDRAFKWRLSEVEGLKKWSSANGRVLLIGDAAHAITPCSGQGAAMGIEDACALGELFADATADTHIQPLVSIFEALRAPRCDRILEYSRFQHETWTLKNPEQIAARNELWKRIGEDWYKKLHAVARPEMMAAFSTPEFTAWLNVYDVAEEVRKMKARSSRL